MCATDLLSADGIAFPVALQDHKELAGEKEIRDEEG